MLDETGKLFDFRRLKQPFCRHKVDESTVYRSGSGCVVEIYMRCQNCGKKFPVEPDLSKNIL